MRHLGPLAAVYALVAALIVPSTPLAQEEATPGAAPATETAPAGSPAPEPGPAPDPRPEPPPTEVAPAPAEAGPALSDSAEAAPAPVAGDPTAAAGPRNQEKGKRVAKAAASVTVTIKDFEFSPASVTIDQGDTVTWHNIGPTPHSATAKDGSFDTDVFRKGGSRSHTFTQPGTFSYYCKPHPFMKGTVTVRAASAGGESGSGSGSGSDTGSGSAGGASSSGSNDTSATDSSSSSSLPATGGDVVALAVLGLLMVGLGAVVRRRAQPE